MDDQDGMLSTTSGFQENSDYGQWPVLELQRPEQGPFYQF
jgi:hypothetical protein